jgi:sporulation protein YlmC with PRC-barrel domain
VRTFSSFLGRQVVTESGRRLGKCRDLRATLGRGRPAVDALVVGKVGWLEHLGVKVGSGRRRRDAVPWETVVRIEGARIVVREGTELE